MKAEDYIDWGILVLFIAVVVAIFYLLMNPNVAIRVRMREYSDRFWKTDFGRKLSLILSFGFLLGLVWMAVAFYMDSDWYPHELETLVYFNSHHAVVGEIQMCTSPKESDKDNLSVLICGGEMTESHNMKVKFWGNSTPDRNKIWKCARLETSMTCKFAMN